ncbi:hypothetical protein INS49_006901 [Diaporthe citri]|uniref:uncharacterized protein n=1 Tax=Diaporthe citri TaxID=83186 RepID=UPI001C8269C2|nr:uncharacterized protein INS49_006901 [Diaporthe citri]KAG6365292.1 hypothetical protein INS49_006901 [Diaporthe citri]
MWRGVGTNFILNSNGIEFYDKTSDPWYRATVPGDKVYELSKSEKFVIYQPEEAASPMGCVKQYQFCNPSQSSDNCGPLAGWYDAALEAAHLFGMATKDMEDGIDPPTNKPMASRYMWLLEVLSLGQASIDKIIMDLGPDALTSPKYLSSGIMGPLPTNQWQLDVRYWWATYLATLQAAVVNTAHGPTDLALDPYMVLPFNSHARDICNNQKIRSTKHVSFSLFGLYFTLVTGVLIIVTSYILEPIFECLYRRRKYREYTFLEWSASETLQLQRIGFQGVGSGTWSGYTDSIPRTKQGEVIASLALEYSPEADGRDGGRGSPEKMNSSMTGAGGTASRDEETDVASLDDLLDASGSQNGSEDGSDPASRWPSISGAMIELHGNSCGSGSELTTRGPAAGDVFRPDT